jgi:hypothetical protein
MGGAVLALQEAELAQEVSAPVLLVLCFLAGAGCYAVILLGLWGLAGFPPGAERTVIRFLRRR